MNNAALNPYRRNAEILRGFFRKPVTLITGLILFLSYIARIVCNIFNSEYAFVTLDIFLCVAFLHLFKQARSKSENPIFGFSAGLIKISSVISYCVCIIATIAVILLSVLLYFIASDTSANIYLDLISVLIMFGLILLISIIPMIFYINLSRMAASFKKSAKSVYLYRKGALGTGIFGILYALITLFAFFLLPTLKELSDLLVYLIGNSFFNADAPSAVIIGIQFNFTDINFDGFTYFDYAAIALSCLSKISVSVFAFKYNGYIKKITEHLTPSQAKVNTEPSPEKTAKTEEDEQNPYNQSNSAQINPQNFVPQAVFRTPVGNTSESKKSCPNCGYESDGKMPFCANCGTKL